MGDDATPARTRTATAMPSERQAGPTATDTDDVKVDTTTPPTPDVDVLCTTFGGEDAVAAMERAGVIIGRESLNDAPDWATVDFLDYPFTKEAATFDDHLSAVKEERPRYAVAPDIEGDIGLGQAIDWADELAEYADVVIVVPKENARPTEVPDRFRVGFPAQPKFGSSAPWSIWEYRDCDDIHLLGGSPTRHFDLAWYGLNVSSVDTASPLKSAKFGDTWTPDGWVEIPEISYYSRVELSYQNIITEWKHQRFR